MDPIIRKIQQSNDQWTLTIPKDLARILGLQKHDRMEFRLDFDEKAMIIKKVGD